MEESYDQAIPPLSIHPKELQAGSQRDTYTPVFIASLFTIDKRWKALSKHQESDTTEQLILNTEQPLGR